jgi:hypothetical protein
MKSLFEAIINKFNATPHNTFYMAIGGQLALAQAPQSWKMPYSVFSLPSNVPEYTFTDTIENPVIQFSVFDDSQSSLVVCNAYDYLTTLFDDCRLSISGGTCHLMERMFSQLLKDPDYWHYIVQYRLIVE